MCENLSMSNLFDVDHLLRQAFCLLVVLAVLGTNSTMSFRNKLFHSFRIKPYKVIQMEEEDLKLLEGDVYSEMIDGSPSIKFLE
ncbi:hypothetical protein Goshw_019054 [Gossypium schwendimanii]|uniref:Uncharacterized protein n=1 Tax=Gossypium schwendimanii TaxID=34291 RepID=A0A7J9KM31_GOSSC|nr:hypothetical protein [Gossypium schwendimanii]